MKFTTKLKEIELTDELLQYLEEKMSSLDHVLESFGSSVHAQVSLILETRHHQKGEIYLAEIVLYLPGKDIVIKAEADTIYNAIDGMKHELREEIEQYKEKNIDRRRDDSH